MNQEHSAANNTSAATIISNFGQLVQFLRATIGPRLQRRHPERPEMRNVTLTSTGLINCLKDAGYDIGASTLTEIEKGRMLPADPDTFIARLCGCLGIEADSCEHKALIQQLAFDIVSRRTGIAVAVSAVPRIALEGTVLDPPNAPQPATG
jgi:hypothetical protein